MNSESSTSYPDNESYLSTKNKFLRLALLVLLGVLGNFLSLELFFSVSFIFGSIATMFAVHQFGVKYGTLVALIVSSYTLILWGHPYAIILFTLEAIIVGTIISKQKVKNLMLADIVYWIFIGMPLIYLFYKHVLGMTDTAVDIILIKQPFNGIINTVIASTLIQLNLLDSFLGRGKREITSMTRVINNSIALFTMLPILLYSYLSIVLSPLDESVSYEMKTNTRAQLYTSFLSAQYEERQQDLNRLYNMRLQYYPEEVWHRRISTFMQLHDFRQVIEARLINSHGETKILFERKDGDVSEHSGNDNIISADKVNLRRDLLFKVKTKEGSTLVFTINKSMFFSLADKTDIDYINVMNNEGDLIYVNRIFPANQFKTSKKSNILHPKESLAAMVMWQKSFYVNNEVIIPNHVVLKTFTSLGTLVNKRYENSRKSMFLAMLITVVVLLLAPIVSLRATNQLKKLSFLVSKYESTGHSESLDWPDTDFEEMQDLIGHFETLINSVELEQSALLDSNKEKDQLFIERNQLIETANAPIFGVDSDGIINEWNKTTETLTGFHQKEALGCSLVNDFVTEDFKEPMRHLLVKALQGNENEFNNFEVLLNKKNTTRVDLLLNASVRRNVFGNIVGVIFFGLDMTKRKEAEAQLIQASKLATVGEMATGVAHEVNQPLNVIRMAAGNALRKITKDNAEIDLEYLKAKLQRIGEQTERAASIIDHLRMFGRRADESPAPMNINTCVASALDMMGEQLRLNNILVVVDIPDEPILVMGHQILFEQVLLNLLSNARDAILAKSSSGQMKIYIAVKMVGNKVWLSMEDTGGGIPDKLLYRVFDPFFTTKEVGKGTGLGLSVSYGIVNEMGGMFNVSNSAEGAEFTIILPGIPVTGL